MTTTGIFIPHSNSFDEATESLIREGEVVEREVTKKASRFYKDFTGKPLDCPSHIGEISWEEIMFWRLPSV
jgi:hypothetical protein